MAVFIGSKDVKKNNPEASDASFWDEFLQEETEFFVKSEDAKFSKIKKKFKNKVVRGK